MPREAFLLYVDDWLSSGKIELMDAHEERGYLRLLLRAWKEPDCGLPTDDLTLAAWSKMGTQWFRETADRNLRLAGRTSGQKVRECFLERGGRLFNERQLREFDYQQAFLATRVANGKRGGRPKKPNDNQVDNLDETTRFREANLDETNLVSSLGLGLESGLKPEKQESASRSSLLDSEWGEFRGVAKEFWLDLIDEDLAKWRFSFSALDLSGKALCIQRLKERLATGQDYRKVFKPTYFSHGEWKREVARAPPILKANLPISPREKARFDELMRD